MSTRLLSLVEVLRGEVVWEAPPAAAVTAHLGVGAHVTTTLL